ncbi:MAG TPA: M14 family murein peptide amidase A [Pyrinomonadaceae bacterium]|nr:M14 family murein peptide amidase A [Pyrinomonadaceae bacterium]
MVGLAAAVVSASRKFVGPLSAAALLAVSCLGSSASAQAPHPAQSAAAAATPVAAAVAPKTPSKFLEPKYLTLGKTVKGRDINAVVYGTGAKRVLVFGGIHGDEPHTTVIARALAVNMNRDTLPPDLTVVIVPDVNPDGLMAATRVNANGVDINRNFPSKTWRSDYTEQKRYPGTQPSSEPETRAVLSLLERYPPHLVVTLHAALGCMNWDGPAGGPFAQVMASVNGYPLCESLGYETPGSLGILVGIDKQVPTVTIELRAKNPSDLVQENLPALLALLKHFAAK